MKILIYSDYWKQKSGYAREMRDLLPEFQKNGHEIGYVALWYGGFPIENEFNVYPTDIVRTYKDPWASDVLKYAINDFEPDILLINQDYYPLFDLSFVLSQPSKHKNIMFGLCDGDGLDFNAVEPVKWIHKHIYKTDFARRQLLEVDKRLTGNVVHPPLNQNDFYELPNRSELRKEYGLEDSKVVLCVARPQLRKNLPALLEAMTYVIKKIPNAILILAATHEPKDFDGSYNNHNVELFINKFGLQDNVMIPRNKDNTPLDDSVMNIQYNLADVNVLTSFGEGFGLSVTESGINKVPTIGVNNAALAETIGDRGWLVEPASYVYSANGVRQAVVNPKDVADKIIYALTHDEERRKKGQLAYDFAKTLTPETRYLELMRIFEQTINENAQPVALMKDNE